MPLHHSLFGTCLNYFQEHIPIISIMCNKGMRGRHWKRMSDIAGFDLTPDSGTTLRKMLKLELGPFMEQFEGISAAGKTIKLEWKPRIPQYLYPPKFRGLECDK